MRTLALVFIPFPLVTRAGRPVVSRLTLAELTQRSEVIFEGSPTREKPNVDCIHKQRAWKVVSVLEGDPSLKGKVVPLIFHKYKFHRLNHPPSYRSLKFKDGLTNLSKPAILFVNASEGECFEMTADGAQLDTADRKQIQALAKSP